MAETGLPLKIDMDDGNFPIAKTALLSLSKTRLSGAHRAIIDVIWCETYGWYDPDSPYQNQHKKRRTRAQIPGKTFEEATWMNKHQVSRAINELLNWNIIGRDKNVTPYVYWFNVNVDEWERGVFREVTRIDNSCQDRQQLSKQASNSYQDRQLGVTRIDNSCQAQTRANTGLRAPLKKDQTKIKLTNNTPPTPPRGKGKKTDPRVKQVIDHYHSRFVQRFGEKPIIDGQKDGAIVKKLLAAMELDKLLLLIDRFFASNDQWIQQSGYTLGVFKTQVNKLIAQGSRASPKGSDDKYAHVYKN